ncbi:YciI family protein [Nocardioides sp.]|uniref:YciI family protein n=1 Tax=Nocardioides sp. TaxID=35761 RepID=UPI0027164863|nr:YciI family protein [Nocardioides sp.]MDO9457831.1 YciI family protein [Nocardioides sp.]
MEYMFLIHTDVSSTPADPASEGFEELMAAWFAYNQVLVDGHHFIAGASLQPAATATTVSTTASGRPDAVVDGPYAETKEDIGGFYVVRADDLDQALDLARAMPGAASVEVRPLMFRPDA